MLRVVSLNTMPGATHTVGGWPSLRGQLLLPPDERKGAVLNGYIFRAVYVLRFGHWHYQPCYPDNEKEVIAIPLHKLAITSKTL